ncbi:MAG: hypothetical protein J5I98_09180 [Phaeodactylibacter sp.]|nr:hypothetical protein [Phaeodactylibacter sp.]
MHDLDRTSLEANGYDYEEAFEMDDEMDDEYDYEYDEEMDDEFDDEMEEEYDEEMDDEYDYEMDDEYDYEMDDEYDYEMDDEYDDEFDYEASGGPFTPEEEAELAFELLSISNQQEEEEFFKKLFRKAAKGARWLGRRIKKGAKKVSRYAYKRIKNKLKSVIGRRLKMIRRLAPYIGGAFGGPIGAKIGGNLSGYASKVFKMELEGLSPEDQEFEIAKRIVRFGGAAARNSWKNAGRMPTEQAIRIGFRKAARKYAPGLLKPIRRKKSVTGRRRKPSPYTGRYPSGKWYRKGNRIVLVGLK